MVKVPSQLSKSMENESKWSHRSIEHGLLNKCLVCLFVSVVVIWFF